ncbi:MAG: hypothetical protein WC125_08825 [Bacteroidales bacterium]
MSNKTKNPDFSKAKEGDECWMYGIGETRISSIEDDYVTVWDDENKYVFDKSGYLYFIEEYIGDAYTQGVSIGLEESPMLFNSFAQFQAYWAELQPDTKQLLDFIQKEKHNDNRLTMLLTIRIL